MLKVIKKQERSLDFYQDDKLIANFSAQISLKDKKAVWDKMELMISAISIYSSEDSQEYVSNLNRVHQFCENIKQTHLTENLDLFLDLKINEEV